MSTILGPESLKLMDEEIARLTAKLSTMQPLSEDYSKTVDLITKLTKARAEKNERAISMDTILTVGANILGMLLVLNYERLNVITSRAITMVWRK